MRVPLGEFEDYWSDLASVYEVAMHFELSDEQSLMRDTLARFLGDRYDLASRRRYLSSPRGFSQENWRDLAQLGLTALAFPEHLGGMNGTPVDTMIVMEEIGYHLAVEPYLETTIAAAAVLGWAEDSAHARILADRIISGEAILSLALYEQGMRDNFRAPRTSVRAVGGSFRLNGIKRLVSYPSADFFLVSASTNPEDGSCGSELLVIPAGVAGLSQNRYVSIDGTSCCDLHLDDVELPGPARIVGARRGAEALEQLIATLAFACSAEAVGILRRMFETTRDYLKSRVQFGAPLSKKQVVRHRLAEMYMHSELARSAVVGAAVRDVGSADWRRSIAAAKVMVNTAADHIGKQAVQLHGGMGVSDEYEISHYYKRLLVLKALFGDARSHSRFLGRMAA